MSHVVSITTKYRDQGALVEALIDVFGQDVVEIHANGAKLQGLWDQWETIPVCTLIVRQATRSDRLADIGFRRLADGTFEQVVDGMDRDKQEVQASLAKLAQRYSRAVTIRQSRLGGYTVAEEATADGGITLKLTHY